MPNRRALAAIAILILLHFWFGLNLILAVPAWEAYDEPGHFGYAASIAARRLWPNHLALQIAGAAIFALWPQFLFNGSMVSNDGASAVFGAAVTWLLLRFAARPSLRRGFVALAILLAGVGIKLTLLAL